jgi:uncharacterized phiE125 gp8 family phage protein
MVVREEPPAPVPLEELKAFLRIAGSEEDALLAGLIRTATELCESFTRIALIEREVEEMLPASAGWRRLGRAPVRAVLEVRSVAADGSTAALAVGDYAVDIDAGGCGWVRGNGGRLAVRYRAGQAADWNGIPEPLRHGTVRLAAHLYAQREGGPGQAPPAAVSALWRPWRQLRLA